MDILLYIILSFTVAIAIAGAVLIVLLRNRRKKHMDFLLSNSRALNELTYANNSFTFYEVTNPDLEHIYDNEIYYDSISCQDYLIYNLSQNKFAVQQQIKKIQSNNNNYSSYLKKVSDITCFDTFAVPTDKFNTKLLHSLEAKLFKRNKLQPDLEYEIKVTLKCSTINGKVYKEKWEIFDTDEIDSLITKLNNKKGYFYNDRDIWDALCRVERGKVSNKMRFAIYKRDGYKCKYCGKKRYDLEIDHIKPIAKGGKSTLDNLQTLCKRCNKKKGATYENELFE